MVPYAVAWLTVHLQLAQSQAGGFQLDFLRSARQVGASRTADHLAREERRDPSKDSRLRNGLPGLLHRGNGANGTLRGPNRPVPYCPELCTETTTESNAAIARRISMSAWSRQISTRSEIQENRFQGLPSLRYGCDRGNLRPLLCQVGFRNT